jgi:hypothetical protein
MIDKNDRRVDALFDILEQKQNEEYRSLRTPGEEIKGT